MLVPRPPNKNEIKSCGECVRSAISRGLPTNRWIPLTRNLHKHVRNGLKCGQAHRAHRHDVFIAVPSINSAGGDEQWWGKNHPPSLCLSFVRPRCFAGGGIAVHGNLPLSHQQRGWWQGQQELQVRRSKEVHGKGGNSNGDDDEGGWWWRGWGRQDNGDSNKGGGLAMVTVTATEMVEKLTPFLCALHCCWWTAVVDNTRKSPLNLPFFVQTPTPFAWTLHLAGSCVMMGQWWCANVDTNYGLFTPLCCSSNAQRYPLMIAHTPLTPRRTPFDGDWAATTKNQWAKQYQQRVHTMNELMVWL